jgi:hypothetical protein
MTAMPKSPVTSIYDSWVRPSYEVRVRGTLIYLWGSAAIKTNANFTKPPVLHIRNDTFGSEITLQTQAAGVATLTTIGRLQPGEIMSLELHNISGVCASCPRDQKHPRDPNYSLESVVACVID